ncbi:ABC transporter permease [Alkalibacter rhizosphaerae]|uniref:ABC transporter permease n=1 Tax=Alkalibacter rhizosphaerae TaxID=2815577 RepID=A0A974XF75_9FIRM|nr:ABC transporter permease [Alkalibacter rhizosphaerae]QSX07620.1 ABC transporter permease [Alkalibacter rhizosphaerae]
MFKHLFTYRLKVLLRDKETIFWTLLFPIALSLFFYMALSGLRNVGGFETISIALVEEQNNPTFETVLESLSTGEDPMFDIRESTLEEARDLLEDSTISGIIQVSDTPSLVVNTSGIRQSILKSFLDEYLQTSSTVARILQEDPSTGPRIGQVIAQRMEYTKDAPISKGEYNMVLGYYYALIAMTCFYGGFLGMAEVNQIQANLSKRAARLNIAPVHKMKAFLYNLSASFLIQLVEMGFFLAFLLFVLKVDFGDKTGWILLTTLVGAVTGLSFGAFISAAVKGSENTKNGIFIGVTMLCSFLAGLMFHEMKYLVQTNVPILARLNPVNLLADSYYSLYVFDSLDRYFQNLAGLLIFTLVFSLGTYLIIRRRKYASL